MRRALSGWRLAGVWLGTAIVLGLVVGLLARSRYDGRYAVPPAGSAEPPLPPPSPSRPMPVPAPAPMIVRPTSAPVVASAAPVEDDDGDRIAGAVGRATLKALRRGDTVHWHKAGREGYVVVSEPRNYPDRTCRNVTATLIGDEGAAQSSVHQWCSPDGDGWAPER